MVIILSARKYCGDQSSTSSESDRAASQNAKTKHSVQRTFRKLSEMWDFARPWRELVRHSFIQITQHSADPCGIRTILWVA
jgi:hypothetical protein